MIQQESLRLNPSYDALMNIGLSIYQEHRSVFYKHFVYDTYDWILAFDTESSNMIMYKGMPHVTMYWTTIRTNVTIGRVLDYWFRSNKVVKNF